jgi:hypothetical protein
MWKDIERSETRYFPQRSVKNVRLKMILIGNFIKLLTTLESFLLSRVLNFRFLHARLIFNRFFHGFLQFDVVFVRLFLRRNELFSFVKLFDVSFHVAGIHELLVAVLAVESFVEVIAEGFLAEFFVTDSTDEVLGIAIKILAILLT